MKTLESLKNIENSLAESKSVYSSTSRVFNETDSKIENLITQIGKRFEINYLNEKKINAKERENLTRMFVDYLNGKSDDFNSHYIQLLAWNLLDIKIMTTKLGTKVSILEYSPNNPFAIYTVIEKTFKLFKKNRINPQKVSNALLLTYLRNYKIVSSRYKKELQKYLISVRFSKDINVCFNKKNVIPYIQNKKSNPEDYNVLFQEKLSRLDFKEKILHTVYFSDVWCDWILNYEHFVCNDNLLRNLGCKFFYLCNEDYQKIIIAKIIYNNYKFNRDPFFEGKCEQYLLPLFKNGNPLKESFWNLNYTGYVKRHLDVAWNFINETFVK